MIPDICSANMHHLYTLISVKVRYLQVPRTVHLIKVCPKYACSGLRHCLWTSVRMLDCAALNLLLIQAARARDPSTLPSNTRPDISWNIQATV